MSPLRNLVKSMAAHARTLKTVALLNPGLQTIYDSLCDVLDALNLELEEEDEGAVDTDWCKFFTSDSENVHMSGRT